MFDRIFDLYRFCLLALIMPAVCVVHAFGGSKAVLPEDFVKASVVVAGPGESLYSCAGHAFFRMQCPSENMDFCFSYESEEISHKVLSFLAGHLKMGMAVVPTAEYIAQFRKEGRGVTEYQLTLPVSVKQELWRVLDSHVDRGMDLPYDYLERGCAISVLHVLEEALGRERLETPEWSPLFEKSRREILASQLDHAPWSRVMIHVLTNGSANMDVPYKEKAVTPAILVELLQKSRLKGLPVLSSVPRVIEKERRHLSGGWFTPMFLSVTLFLLTLLSVIRGRGIMLRILVAIQLLLGLLNVYLVFFSSLCATEWSWLLVPFNPLPAMFWKWRSKWELPYAAVILLWCAVMLLSPEKLTDPALVLLAFSTAGAFAADRLVPRDVPLPILLGKYSDRLFHKNSNHFNTKTA